jgi:hypothetical protein
VTVIRFRCPELPCPRGPVAVHVTAPERVAAAIDAAACRHITAAEREQLAAGTVPARLAIRGER